MSASSSAIADESSSILRPSLIMRWMRFPKVLGSSRLNPDVNNAAPQDITE
jgi:hypothetical protein